MSLLERANNSALEPDESADRRTLAAAAGYGLVAALSLALLMLMPVLIAWVVDPHSSASWTGTLTFVAAGWALVHGGSVAVPGDGVEQLVLAPLLVTLLAVYLAKSAARALLATVQPGPRLSRAWWQMCAAFVGGYLVAGLAMSVASRIGAAHVVIWTVLPGALVVAAVGLGWAQWREDLESESELPPIGLRERLPSAVPRAVRPAAQGVVVFVALGAVVVVLLAVAHLGRMQTVNGQLHAGITGTVILSLLQVTLLPNLALYAGATLTGAGVHIGAVTVSTSGVHAGVLPMLPALGAVPDAGPMPAWAGLAPVLPVLIGVFIGWRACAGHSLLAPVTAKLATSATAAAMAAVALTLLAWCARARVSPGALEHVGASWTMFPLLLVELAAGACAAAAALHWLRTRR